MGVSRSQQRLTKALQMAVAIAEEAHTLLEKGDYSAAGKLLAALAGELPGYRPETDAIHKAIGERLRPGPAPTIDRNAAMKMFIEGRSREEIAEAMGTSYEIVRRQLAAVLNEIVTKTKKRRSSDKKG
jgi:hypothetical protein